MSETLSATTEDVSSKKRGRKTVNVNYFDVREEDAVRSFLLAETSEEKTPQTMLCPELLIATSGSDNPQSKESR